MLLSKLVPGTAKPLTRPKEVLPMGPCLATDSGPPYLNLVLYTEHVLLCLHSHDPQVSLEPVVEGPAEEVLKVAQVGVRESAKLVVERFEHLPEGA
jgi:hypothetical protein